MKKPHTICYVAGKSGGHIIPCITLAQEYKQKHPAASVLFFSSPRQLDRHILSTAPVDRQVQLPFDALPSKWYHLPIFVLNLIITLTKTFFHLVARRPKKVISTGGYISIPVLLCARLLAIPIELYELNVEPGKAVSWLASSATELHTCFAQTQLYFPKKKCIKTAYPIRFFDTTKQFSQKEADALLGFDQQKTTFFIIGGSQGSAYVNRAIRHWVESNQHMHEHIQIIHQTGQREYKKMQAWYDQLNIPAVVFDFDQDIAAFYAAADVIVCRSGAGTLFEVLFFNKQCITIPLETEQNNHQLANAQAMQAEHDELFTMIKQEAIEKDAGQFHQMLNACVKMPVQDVELAQRDQPAS